MTDLVLPSAAPIGAYMDETVAVLADLLEDTPAALLAGLDFSAQGVWTFARPGAPPLPLEQSLDDAGVVDGTLLTLVSASRTERYRPIVEDVIDAIADFDDAPAFDRAALYRFAALAVPVVAVVIAAVAVRAWWESGRSWLWPVVVGVIGLGVLAGSYTAVRVYRNGRLSESLLIAATALLSGAAAMAIPLPRGATGLGAPQLAAASAVVLVLTVVTRGGPRRHAVRGSFIAVVTMASTVAAVLCGYGFQQWVPAGAIAYGLLVVANSATMTAAASRIALPPIPVPGEIVDHDDLVDGAAPVGNTADGADTWRAIIDSVPVSAARLAERARLARGVLIGYVTGGALVAAVAAIACLARGHYLMPSLITALLVAVICGLRSRLFAERWCVWALLTAAVAIPTGVAARLCGWYPHHGWMILTGYLVAAAAAVIVGDAASRIRRVPPLVRWAVQLLDGLLVAAIVPMLLWVSGVYDLLRNVRF